MEPVETVIVSSEEVRCDGGGGALGHPMVYYHMNGNGEVSCGYCGRHFVLQDHASADSETQPHVPESA